MSKNIEDYKFRCQECYGSPEACDGCFTDLPQEEFVKAGHASCLDGTWREDVTISPKPLFVPNPLFRSN